MAHKLLIFLLIASVSYAKSHMIHSDNTKSSPFASIKTLEGCCKGNCTKGISDLKIYLRRFGYLSETLIASENEDEFDDTLESAIKTYQTNYNLNPIGAIDADTVSKMTMARCGIPDIINGVNVMQMRKNSTYHIKYAHYNGYKWQPSNRLLTYKLLGNFPEVAKLPVQLAFKRWASVTKFTFAEVTGAAKADLTLAFFRRDHGDGCRPFDGRGGVVAHAFYPPDGRLHYDLDELWFYRFKNNKTPDLLSVSLHEIGHLLGLKHSKVKSAVMFPSFVGGEIKDLDPDDINGIKDLYNL